MIVYYYYMITNWVFEGKIVLFVVFFFWSACKVQKDLVNKKYLVRQYCSSSYFVDCYFTVFCYD